MNGHNTSIEGPPPATLTRKKFLKAVLYSATGVMLASIAVLRFISKSSKRIIPGKIIGSSPSIGHLLRDAKLPVPTNNQVFETVIIGGGIAGLSAAWWLKKSGYEKFALLELESEVGGNSRSDKNAISSYPLGAHYLPLPGPEASLVRSLLEEFDVIQGYDSQGIPIYNEFFLAADPHERLLIHGYWQEGLVPQIGLSADDRRQLREFFAFIEVMKVAKGSDGRRAFVIPVNLSSHDSKFRELDQISMADFLEKRGWASSYLRWYVNYCCRDDYGATADKVSAWAGLHYFASRIGIGSNADAHSVLTWPEGNGWLVNKLRDTVNPKIKPNALVFSVANHQDLVLIDYLDTITHETFRITAKKVIFAAPRFIALRIVDGLASSNPQYIKKLNYAPWMVANVSLRSAPEGNGAPLSWDNVSYHSDSLGYIVATHQSLGLFPKKTVLTYYQPLSSTDPISARKQALEKTHQEWVTLITEDLTRMHPGIQDEIENIDVCLWGHGMIIPELGFIFGRAREELAKPFRNIHFAHSDMSGVSIFEEAQYQGIQGAKIVLDEIRHPVRSLL
jgi:protoporphyrinogen oxidase